jgi:hypothetical protein
MVFTVLAGSKVCRSPSGAEQPVVHRLRQRLALDLFHDETEKRIVRVDVFELRTRREIGWVRECNRQ